MHPESSAPQDVVIGEPRIRFIEEVSLREQQKRQRIAAMREMYERGESVEAIGRAIGVGTGSVRQMLSLHRIRRPTGLRGRNDWRLPQIFAMYRSGHTLQEIGAEFGVTRERIRQILRREGVSPEEGGALIDRLANIEVRQARERRQRDSVEANTFNRHGMSKSAINAISPLQWSSPHHPLRIFERWRNNVRRNGLRCEIKFREWWGLWCESGKWEERGRGYGYWMARWDTNQPWTKDNVRIVVGAERASDSYIQHPVSERMAKAALTRAARK